MSRTAERPGEELDIEQGSPEWLGLRMRLRMASETPAVLGISPYQTADSVRRAKRGLRGSVTPAMRKGSEQEPLARAAYAKRFGSMRPAFYVAGDYGCSLDGIDGERATILEIKTPYRGRDSDRWRMAERGRVAAHDQAQIQHQLMVCGAAIAHLWVWDADSRRGTMVEIKPDPQYWTRIRGAWDAFWPTLSQEPRVSPRGPRSA